MYCVDVGMKQLADCVYQHNVTYFVRYSSYNIHSLGHANFLSSDEISLIYLYFPWKVMDCGCFCMKSALSLFCLRISTVYSYLDFEIVELFMDIVFDDFHMNT